MSERFFTVDGADYHLIWDDDRTGMPDECEYLLYAVEGVEAHSPIATITRCYNVESSYHQGSTYYTRKDTKDWIIEYDAEHDLFAWSVVDDLEDFTIDLEAAEAKSYLTAAKIAIARMPQPPADSEAPANVVANVRLPPSPFDEIGLPKEAIKVVLEALMEEQSSHTMDGLLQQALGDLVQPIAAPFGGCVNWILHENEQGSDLEDSWPLRRLFDSHKQIMQWAAEARLFGHDWSLCPLRGPKMWAVLQFVEEALRVRHRMMFLPRRDA